MRVHRHQEQPGASVVTADGQRRLQLALEAEIAAAGAAGVTTFNGRSGFVNLTEADVLTALGPGHFPISIIDLPSATPSIPLLRMILTEGLDFISGVATAGLTATSTSVLRLFKNGAANGTVTFNAGSGSGTVVITSAYADGDLFELYPPTSIDATLDQVSITLETA